MGRCIIGGSSDSMCFSIFLRSSTGMYICWYLMCYVGTSVILKSLFKSSIDLCRASITSFNFCLLTWATYLVTFRIQMTWTRSSCCLLCACIGWFTCCLISHVSLVVAVPVSHFNVSPRKDNRLLFDHGFSELISSNHTADFMMGL